MVLDGWAKGVLMLLRNQKTEEKKLVLGDYVTINIAACNDDLQQFDSLFQRIVKQRGELNDVQQRTDTVINVRNKRREILQNSELQDAELQNSA